MRTRSALRFVAILFLGLLTACGGSDRDPEGLDGTYLYVSFFGAAPSGIGIAQWGRLEADEDGWFSEGEAAQNIGGTVLEPEPLFDGTIPYEIGPGCRLRWGTGEGPLGPIAHAEGGTRGDKRLAVMTNVQEGSHPGLMLIGKPMRSASLRTLEGRYHIGILYRNTDAQDGSIWGTTTFFGDGTAETEAFVNFRGNPAGPFDFEDDYTVESGGLMSWDFGGDLGTFYGGILAGGKVLVLAGKAGGDGAPSIAVMVKASDGDASDARLWGDYHLVTMHAFQADELEDELGWAAATAEAAADGDGAIEVESILANTDGVIEEQEEGGTIAYEVEADGTLIVTAPFSCRGGVSPDGRFAVFTGGAEEDDDPQIWILLR